VECIFVSHTHWDREWYRTYQAFRARLVDTVDRVLELIEADPDYRFHLDGQSVILEDYLEVRPGRRSDLVRAAQGGRMSLGPWYVQPDSLMPSGESHIRNLLEGRRVAQAVGPVSAIAYTPDSFGHPAQFPQLFDGFGLSAFVYARGSGLELQKLPSEYRWVAPDGSSILACLLVRGYSNASQLPADVSQAVDRLGPLVEQLRKSATADRVLLMNGSDHTLPDPNTKEVTEALAVAIDGKVVRGLLEDFVDGLPTVLVESSGELLGARLSNLLPGVWSTRTYLKLRNRAAEAALEGWAEPWAALGRILGGPDERPSLRLAWRSLLHNQAHDSICGCSQDTVHEQMIARYDLAQELADETTARSLDHLTGGGTERRDPWTDEVDIAVFNPSPNARTDVVTVPLEAFPPWRYAETHDIHPLVWANLRPEGFTVDGSPARLVPAKGNRRVRLTPNQTDWEVQFVADDVPAFGYKKFHLAPSKAWPVESDEMRTIHAGGAEVSAKTDGTLSVAFGDTAFDGLGAIEDIGDRGDTYDFDPVEGAWDVERVATRRSVHPGGIQELEVVRTLRVPSELEETREDRSPDRATVTITTTARVAPGVPHVDLEVVVDNAAHDHRLRLLFPTGNQCGEFETATTFDVAWRSTAAIDDSDWVHPAGRTFPNQGWISANGLTVAAPGLYEAEVSPDGVIAVTLLRAVGWLSRPDLVTRPSEAGPSLATPGAQCTGRMTARISLMASSDPGSVHAIELGMRGVIAVDESVLKPEHSLLALEPRSLVLSALKPAEDGDGVVVRVYNPNDVTIDATLSLGFPASSATLVALDESASDPIPIRDGRVSVEVRARSIRSVLIL
jgi:alpha-mannosidase